MAETEIKVYHVRVVETTEYEVKVEALTQEEAMSRGEAAVRLNVPARRTLHGVHATWAGDKPWIGSEKFHEPWLTPYVHPARYAALDEMVAKKQEA